MATAKLARYQQMRDFGQTAEPSGQYGGGTVQLWDRGYWAPEPGMEDVDKALEKGERLPRSGKPSGRRCFPRSAHRSRRSRPPWPGAAW